MNVEYEYPSKKFEKVTITLTADEADRLCYVLHDWQVRADFADGTVETALIRALENPQP